MDERKPSGRGGYSNNRSSSGGRGRYQAGRGNYGKKYNNNYGGKYNNNYNRNKGSNNTTNNTKNNNKNKYSTKDFKGKTEALEGFYYDAAVNIKPIYIQIQQKK